VRPLVISNSLSQPATLKGLHRQDGDEVAVRQGAGRVHDVRPVARQDTQQARSATEKVTHRTG
jgi:hypothetical protein